MNLAHQVSPKVNESLVGFLMRAAEANHLPSLSALDALLGRTSRPPGLEEAERLAEFCRCSVSEITQLFGFQLRREDGVRCWRLGPEWITKANFVSSRSLAVCTDCLREIPYVPGTWEVALYRTCAFHRTRLLTRCPDCHKPLRWTRPAICRCGCGFDLRCAEGEPGSPAAWFTAQLIEHRLDPGFRLSIPATVPDHIGERLAALSLDGLCKTIWVLGHRIADFNTCTIGHGRTKPKGAWADRMIEQAFSLLAGWPESLWERLTLIAQDSLSKSSVRLYSRAFKPLATYIEQELADKELAFIRLVYEQQIRRLWRELGMHNLPRQLDQQLRFELEH